MKKQQTLASAEEEHLAEMSKSSTKTVKKVKKTKTVVKKTSVEKEETLVGEVISKNILEKEEKDDIKQIVQGTGGNDIKKKTKSKKTKKSENESQNISVKSSFSKFDALQKRNLIHVRSSDTKKTDKLSNPQEDKNVNCKLCAKPVYKMEEVKAEKSVYHKNCFRCHECNKQLKVDNYQSHEGHPYCMIHFKLLFAPKAVEEVEPQKPQKPELIIRENEPMDLPPDVVRASDLPDLGLEDLHQLNVRSRFQVFEKGVQPEHQEQRAPTETRPTVVKRSTSILSKVARLQAHGFSGSIEGDHSLTNVENSDFEDEGDGSSSVEDDVEDVDLVRSKKRTRERPVGIGKAMNDIKTKFEKGPSVSKDERREERKLEIQNIRSRLFMGKQARIKEMYQQAVAESEQAIVSANKKPELEVDGVARSLKERFERGEVFRADNDNDNNSNGNNIKSDETPSDFKAETSKVSQKFKFFESYRPTEGQKKQFRITPPREGVVKMPSTESSDEVKEEQSNEETLILEKSRTTAKMLDKFREMELNKHKAQEFGPKPLKRFTPPPDGGRRVYQAVDSEEESDEYSEGSSETEEESEDENTRDAIRRAKLLEDDEALKEAQAAARAKQLRAKFEKWEVDEIQREANDGRVDIFSQSVSDETNIESTKSIRERFENMKTGETRTPIRPRYQVNRFV